MKVKNKPLRRKIVVALLGMCMAVSSYTTFASQGTTTQEPVDVAVQGPASTTAVQSTPATPQTPFDYSYNYYGYGYNYYYYYNPAVILNFY